MTQIQVNGSVFIVDDMLKNISDEMLQLMVEDAIEYEDYEHAEILKRELYERDRINRKIP